MEWIGYWHPDRFIMEKCMKLKQFTFYWFAFVILFLRSSILQILVLLLHTNFMSILVNIWFSRILCKCSKILTQKIVFELNIYITQHLQTSGCPATRNRGFSWYSVYVRALFSKFFNLEKSIFQSNKEKQKISQKPWNWFLKKFGNS